MHKTAIITRLSGPDNETRREPIANVHRREAPRSPLSLEAITQASTDREIRVIIRNISAGGLLLEIEPSSLSVEDRFRIDMPEVGALIASIVWQNGPFSGCQFDKEISTAALKRARLKSCFVPGQINVVAFSRRGCSFSDGRAAFAPEVNLGAAFLISLLAWLGIAALVYLVLF